MRHRGCRLHPLLVWGGIFLFFINGIWVWVGVGFGFGLVIYKYSIYKYLHSMNIVIIRS